MSQSQTTSATAPPASLDYSLIGSNAKVAVERGLAEARWYQSPVPKPLMRQLLQRRNGPALRDTLLWLSLIATSGSAGGLLWGTWWCVIPFGIYGILYASSSDSRWHESGHGTAFKSDWLNNALYELASFMVMRESVIWRWSHARHHSDTIIVGRDPEIAVPRPPDLRGIALSFFNLPVYKSYFAQLVRHSFGHMGPEEKTFVPESAFPTVYRNARISLSIYATVIGIAVGYASFLPLMYIGLVNLYGSWLMVVYGLTQHAGLAENVLDHRLNCRTVYMNRVNRFLYWNMNYHLEHHMFPLVPYHALPKLHEIVKGDQPEPYHGLWATYREIVPALLKQIRDPSYHVERTLPRRRRQTFSTPAIAKGTAVADGWIDVCDADAIQDAEAVRFDWNGQTYSLFRDTDGTLRATDGMCTHGNAHLADGLVLGNLVECPKHNGRFRLDDGSPARPPVCKALRTHEIEEADGRIRFRPTSETTCPNNLEQ